MNSLTSEMNKWLIFLNMPPHIIKFTCWEEDDIDFISDDEDDICCELTEDTCLLLKPLLSAWVEVAKSAFIPVDSLLVFCKRKEKMKSNLGKKS